MKKKFICQLQLPYLIWVGEFGGNQAQYLIQQENTGEPAWPEPAGSGVPSVLPAPPAQGGDQAQTVADTPAL